MSLRSLASRLLDSFARRVADRLEPGLAARTVEPLAARLAERLASEHSDRAIDTMLGRLAERFDQEHDRRIAERQALEAERAGLEAQRAGLEAQRVEIEARRTSGHWVNIDYPVRPKARWGTALGLPPHRRLTEVVRGDDETTLRTLRMIVGHAEGLRRIACTTSDPAQPFWLNDWLPGLDGAALYAFVASRRPRLVIEVGSGNSTKFLRRSVDDHGLDTRIVSIDPHPRAEIDALCHEVVREPLEDTDLSLFERLQAGDVCFIDNSHRSFQNSDVTVAMLEVLPMLRPGVLVGIHDILLPNDYPDDWRERFYNEQYLLAAFLLGGHAGMRIVLPALDASFRPEMAALVDPIWNGPEFEKVSRHGGAFWLETV